MENMGQNLTENTASAAPSQSADRPFVPVADQYFRSHREWVTYASSWLTCHVDHNNTEHGDTKGYRGHHFTAMCFDQKGRRCTNGGDMRRADEENAFPVWWIWPDQIYGLLSKRCQPVERSETAQ